MSGTSTPKPTSNSPSPAPGAGPIHKTALSAVERQRAQLDKLLKDPAKPAYIPAPPKEKTIRPAREMMKNVQGSSAGAGSGEFHVYKAGRRREYERLKLMEEEAAKEKAVAEFESKKRQWEEEADTKTSKNRAKRQKKKERTKGAAGASKPTSSTNASGDDGVPFKKKRLVNGEELRFRKPGEESDDEDGRDDGNDAEGGDDDADVGPRPSDPANAALAAPPKELVLDTPRITIHED